MIKKLTTTFLLLFSFIVFSQTATHLNFDGVDDYISVTMPSNIPIAASNYTIEAMVKPEELNGRGIVGWGNYGVINQVNALRFEGSSGLRNYWWSNDALANFTFNLNTWYHVAVTYDGSTRKFYVDGVEIENIASSGINVPNANNFRIGSTNFGEYFKGGMDDVRIWNVARTASEISNNKDKELVGNETGLVAYYKFNQGTDNADNSSITSATDVTTNNNATLKNFALTGTTSNWAYDASRVLNTAPIFTSTPITTIDAYTSYDYNITTSDLENDTQILSINTIPSWLTYVKKGSVSDFTSLSFPFGIATDASNNIYLANRNGHSIIKISPTGSLSTLAGGSLGTTDGNGSSAKFNWPEALTVDSNGNVYVADTFNHRIRKITPSGDVTTLAGSSAGFSDGNGSTAQFNNPQGIAIDGSGNVYVSDTNNHRIRKITPSGDVTTLAGSISGYLDGTGTAAQFKNPSGIALDTNGNVYVGDLNNRIRKITPSGEVTTFAGNGTGNLDGDASTAQFNEITAIVIDFLGNLYISENKNSKIRKVTPAGDVTSLDSFNQGTTTFNYFSGAKGIALDNEGNLYISDTNNNKIKKIELKNSLEGTPISSEVGNYNVSLKVQDKTGETFQNFTIDVVDNAAPTITTFSPLDEAANVEIDTNFQITFSETIVKDTGNITILDASDDSIVETIPVTDATVTIVDNVVTINPNTNFVYNKIYYIQIANNAIKDPAGNNFAGINDKTTWNFSVLTNTQPVFVSSLNSPLAIIDEEFVYRVLTDDAEGDNTTLSATTKPSWLSLQNTKNNVSTYSTTLSSPVATAIDSKGNWFVVEKYSHQIKKITTDGTVSSFAGGNSSGFVDGNGTTAKFYNPQDIAIDAQDNLYITDSGNNRIRKITPSGDVSTIAGSNYGDADGNGTNAMFRNPYGIAIDVSGNLYITDLISHKIRKLTPSGDVSTIAGSSSGNTDGNGSAAKFSRPAGIAIDTNGNLFVADMSNYRIRKITPTGDVTTIAGSTYGFQDGLGVDAKFNSPTAIAIDTSNNLYISDNRRIRKISTTGNVSTIAGTGGYGLVDGAGSVAVFASTEGLIVNKDANLLIADTNNNKIRKLSLSDVLSGTPPSSAVGSHNIVLSVTDGKSTPVTQSFTLNVAEFSVPIISSLSPLDDGNDIAINTNLEIIFSENIAKGTGNITIYDASDNSVVEAIDVTSGNVTISNTVVSINPTSDLAYNKSYYVHIAATAFKNSSDKNFVGIVDNTTWNFSTLQGLPTLTTTDATAIGENTVTFGGEITNEGLASSVTERGIVFSTYALDTDPEIGEINTTKIIVGSGLGVFTDTQTSLESNRKYAYRAYAINSSGVSYGDLKTFITYAKTTDAFITRWKTSSANEAISFIQNSSVNIDCKVDWGDGSPVETFTSFPVSHTYTTAASYEVKITGNFPGFEIGNKTAFDRVDQWGNQIWISLANSFRGCTRISTFNAFNDILNTPNVPDLSAIIAGGLYGMFENTYFRDENIANWDVSNVTDFSGMFKGTLRFNQDISKWNMSNATNLNAMFENAVEFNQDLNAWDVKKVTTTTDIFKGAIAYNQSLENWVFDNQVNQINIDLAIPNIATANMDATLFGWYQYYVSENPSNTYPILFTLSGSYCKFTVSEISNFFAKGINLGGIPQDCTALDINKFTGAVNSSWFEAGNWSKNSVPTETEDVDIPSGQTVDVDMSFFEVAKANNLYLNGTLNINSEGELLVKGFLKVFSNRIININNGKLLLEKFVDSAIGLPNLNFHKNLDTNWHLISLPVIRSSIEHLVSNGNLATGTGGNLGFASYNNALKPATGWQYINASSTGELINGKGYIIKRASAGITSFYGELNTTAKTEMAITEGGVGVNTNSWNLIGNPYTYPISVGAFLSERTNNNISQLDASFAAVYKWDGSEYVIHNLGRISESIFLNPGESFFVNAKSGGGLITFTKPEPSSGGLGGPRKSTNNKIITQFSVKLNVSDGNQSASTEIKYLENATIGLDVGYDAGVFGGVSTNFDVFTHLVSNDNTNDFGIQCLPFNKIEEMVVPVGISLISDTEITFSIKNVIMPEGVTVYLEDRLNGVFIPLEENKTDYTIKVLKDTNKIGRFFIHTTSKSLRVSNSLLNDVLIYKKDESTLTITGLNSGDVIIKLHTILGKEVLKTSLKSKDIINIPLPKLSKGIYIIQLETLQGKLSKKIMID